MPDEEQRADCRVCGRKRSLDGPALGECDDAGDWTCLRLGYTREHERAEGLAAKVAALEAGAAQRTLLKEVDDTAYAQLRTRSMEAEARAEGLAKELAELTVERDNLKHSARVLENDRDENAGAAQYAEDDLEKAETQVVAATARVAEMQDRMVAAFGEGTDETMLVAISHEHEAEVATLEKQLAALTEENERVRRIASGCSDAADKARGELAELEKQLADAIEGYANLMESGTDATNRAEALERQLAEKVEDMEVAHEAHLDSLEAAQVKVDRAQAATTEAEAELARLRALPDGMEGVQKERIRGALMGIGDLAASPATREVMCLCQAVVTDEAYLFPAGGHVLGWHEGVNAGQLVQVVDHLAKALAAPLPSAQQIPAPATALAPARAPQRGEPDAASEMLAALADAAADLRPMHPDHAADIDALIEKHFRLRYEAEKRERSE